MTKDGKPYGPVRYQEIVEQLYQISKAIHTSYLDLVKITPRERNLIIKSIIRDRKKEKEIIEQNLAKMKDKRRN